MGATDAGVITDDMAALTWTLIAQKPAFVMAIFDPES